MKSDFSFQDDAIKSIVSDFKLNPTAKNLLVIPTGGGKTLTAIRAVNELIKKGVLKEDDKVLWVVHYITLRDQTRDVLNDNNWGEKFSFSKLLPKVLQIEMITKGENLISQDIDKKIKMIIIDEAHHSAASSYQSFFQPNYNILGLTATPTRNDDNPLEFDKIIYSITTRELIRKNVIIEPIIHSVKTGIYIDINSLIDGTHLDRFNTESRNQFIAKRIFKNKNLYKKVLIYVRTVKHTMALCKVLQKENKFQGNYYDHIGYIYGGENESKNLSNNEYLKKNKEYDKSIIVNCGVLTEGFDDPTINTVVMAVPTNSVVYYLQCAGRAIRTPQDSIANSVFLVEFEDNMPNIRYRIDNKWLFADISDVLEPQIIDIDFESLEDFKIKYTQTLNEHNIKVNGRIPHDIEKPGDIEKVNLLLYNSTQKLSDDTWDSLLINEKNREKILTLFNTLCINIEKYYDQNPKWIFNEKFGEDGPFEGLDTIAKQTDFLRVLELSYFNTTKKEKVERLKYYFFKYIEAYPDGLLEFLCDCVNIDDILSEFQYAKVTSTYVVKFPLPLSNKFEALYATTDIIDFLDDYINILFDIRNSDEYHKQYTLIQQELYKLSNIPIPIRCLNTIPEIVKNELKDYTFELNEEK
jgi:superfamily II DNA or RNA helicase